MYLLAREYGRLPLYHTFEIKPAFDETCSGPVDEHLVVRSSRKQRLRTPWAPLFQLQRPHDESSLGRFFEKVSLYSSSAVECYQKKSNIPVVVNTFFLSFRALRTLPNALDTVYDIETRPGPPGLST
jgi:hypothetical protein